MRKLCQAISAFMGGLLLCGLLTGAAVAAGPAATAGFLDVSPASPCYEAEPQDSVSVLREYAATSAREYFADYFAYWVRNREIEEKIEQLRSATPETYAYFEALEADGWTGAEAA